MAIKQQLASLIGQSAEQQACRYLKQQGLRHRQSNYRCKAGEIDLVMQDGQELVFVEVKFRRKADFGYAQEYFDRHKRRKFERAVQHYLQSHGLNPDTSAFRIDLVAITNNNLEWITHI
ncbi:UPF0102 protein [Saliniradius amylolyticus]|uniref:UPF0102 protein HMF8227_02484 n=1 Tax=Saliniradius amylolyticus TaxID=2183582 RepID=A0A2S2E5K9_9ALTE|nr:YraN family protein [Saliniradius amylolyticus]AWL12936.1 UPF0102 protein [Saliniradius amylolyticus]